MRRNQQRGPQRSHALERFRPAKHGSLGLHRIAEHWEAIVEEVAGKQGVVLRQPDHHVVLTFAGRVIELECNIALHEAIFRIEGDVGWNITAVAALLM